MSCRPLTDWQFIYSLHCRVADVVAGAAFYGSPLLELLLMLLEDWLY